VQFLFFLAELFVELGFPGLVGGLERLAARFKLVLRALQFRIQLFSALREKRLVLLDPFGLLLVPGRLQFSFSKLRAC